MTPLVQVSRLSRAFGASKVLDGVDLTLLDGETVALLGRSGSGKTTLLRALAGLDDVDEDTVRAPSSRAVVFQDARLLPWKRVWRNVALGLRGDGSRERAEAALVEVGLGHKLDAWPATLSGGEAQRVALARAFVREPRLLLLDEPFAALDALTRLRMHALLRALWRAHRPAVLLVTHDVEEAIALADRVLVLDCGHLVGEEPVDATLRESPAAVAATRERLLQWLGLTDAPSVPRSPWIRDEAAPPTLAESIALPRIALRTESS